MTSALVATWHHANGAMVKKGDVLVSLETDKVSNELMADEDGVLSIQVGEGEEVEIGTVIGSIAAAEGGEGTAVKEVQKAEAEVKEIGSGENEEKGEAVEILVPAAGESITSATVGSWAVKDGETVKKGDLLVVLETDKVSQELMAEVSGVVKVEVEEGTEIEIGGKLGMITPGGGGGKVEKEIVKGEPKQEKEAAPIAKKVEPIVKEVKVEKKSGDETRVTRRKMSPLRRKIATHLVNAQQSAAILTTFNEVDMTAVMELRKAVQDDFVAKHGVKLGFMSLFTKATVQALKDVPAINGRIEGEEIVENHFYDIGIAIGTEKGLIVPVVRDCDQKSFAEIEKEIIRYATRAKEGKIELSDLTGGVFTISNGGVYGSLLSTPILNPPQSGILGMHTIQQRPMAINGEVKIRPMMYLAMSYDHRLVDGKEAVTFLIRIKECLENPTRMMLEM